MKSYVQHAYRIQVTTQVYLVGIIHGHADTATVFECEHLHSVFFPTSWSEHQLQFTGLFNDIVSSLVLKPKQSTLSLKRKYPSINQ